MNGETLTTALYKKPIHKIKPNALIMASKGQNKPKRKYTH